MSHLQFYRAILSRNFIARQNRKCDMACVCVILRLAVLIQYRRVCKSSGFEPPFGDLGVTHRVHLWLDGRRIVDFLLAIIELFSLVLTAAALLSEICQNRRFLKGWVTLCVRKF